MNLYDMVANNSICKFDPDGLSWLSTLCSCPNECPYGLIHILDVYYKFEPNGTTPAKDASYDAAASAVDDISKVTDIPGYDDDPMGTIINNTTFNVGSAEAAINGWINSEEYERGVWLFIRFKYKKCGEVPCFPEFWLDHTEWLEKPLSRWIRGKIGQEKDLNAFFYPSDALNYLVVNSRAAAKKYLGNNSSF